MKDLRSDQFSANEKQVGVNRDIKSQPDLTLPHLFHPQRVSVWEIIEGYFNQNKKAG